MLDLLRNADAACRAEADAHGAFSAANRAAVSAPGASDLLAAATASGRAWGEAMIAAARAEEPVWRFRRTLGVFRAARSRGYSVAAAIEHARGSGPYLYPAASYPLGPEVVARARRRAERKAARVRLSGAGRRRLARAEQAERDADAAAEWAAQEENRRYWAERSAAGRGVGPRPGQFGPGAPKPAGAS